MCLLESSEQEANPANQGETLLLSRRLRTLNWGPFALTPILFRATQSKLPEGV